MAVTDWGGANSRFLGLVSVWAARSFDQTTFRPSVIKRIRQIDVKYITHITSFGVTCVNTHVWAAEVDSPLNSYLYVHWILDFKQLLLLSCICWIYYIQLQFLRAKIQLHRRLTLPSTPALAGIPIIYHQTWILSIIFVGVNLRIKRWVS